MQDFTFAISKFPGVTPRTPVVGGGSPLPHLSPAPSSAVHGGMPSLLWPSSILRPICSVPPQFLRPSSAPVNIYSAIDKKHFILPVCLSICHTDDPHLYGSVCLNVLCTTWWNDASSFLGPNFAVHSSRVHPKCGSLYKSRHLLSKAVIWSSALW